MARIKIPWLQKYSDHQRNAKKDGKLFFLTFEEWLLIWMESGHLLERGCHRGQYVMARFGDKGAYEVGNVRIITAEDNCKERRASEQTRLKMSKSAKRIRNTPEMRAKVSAQMKGNTYAAGSVRTPEEKAHLSAFNKGRKLRLSSQERQRRSEHMSSIHAQKRLAKLQELHD